jgi:hypothetical protein
LSQERGHASSSAIEREAACGCADATNVPAWRRAIGGLPTIEVGRWAVGGSAALALHGVPVEPRDVDVIADRLAVSELVDGLGETVVMDSAPWDRGDVRAARRVLAVVEGFELEILVEVEAVDAGGHVVMTTPSLDLVESVLVFRRLIPVIPLSTMLEVLEATGRDERAALARKAMDRGRS